MKPIYLSSILFFLLFNQKIDAECKFHFSESLVAIPSSEMSFTVIPEAIGKQLVRTSLPLPRGFLRDGKSLEVSTGKNSLMVGMRPLSWYPEKKGEPRTIRRVLVTFPFNFIDSLPVEFKLKIKNSKYSSQPELPVSISVVNDSIKVSWKNGTTVNLKLLAPAYKSKEIQPMEIVEANKFYLWQRLIVPDPKWPRIIEMRLDALGGVTVIAHVQRIADEDGYAPELGWEVRTSEKVANGHLGLFSIELRDNSVIHSFKDGTKALWILGKDALSIYHPAAPLKRRGGINVSRTIDDKLIYRYLRCTPEERVPMQPFSWQRIEIVLAPPQLALLRPTLESPHIINVSPKIWEELYGIRSDLPADLSPDLTRLLNFHNDAIIASSCVGDDWGNLTGYKEGNAHGNISGMNRLNHCPPIFLNGWHTGDKRLVETALLWCDNFHDQSIWWGEPKRGGTRYNNLIALGKTPLTIDYMWRSNGSIDFCTKGYDSFWLAWEQTGDPRMKESFDAQMAYAIKYIHTDLGETRNIGDVRDFIRLYQYSGEETYLDNSLRLFRELVPKLSADYLFDQNGRPINPDTTFIDGDEVGFKVGYAKPYIIGYALCGLPELMKYAPDEPKMREVVNAVANFLADSQDPIGTWRYPHPRSSLVYEHMENIWQIMQATQILGPDEKFLNAIEAGLRERLHSWLHTGTTFSILNGWEISTGKVKSNMELYGLYRKPTDRDASRDYTEGNATFGTTQPEGLVYFQEILAFYLKYRPASRLFEPLKPEEPLSKVLKRVPLKMNN